MTDLADINARLERLEAIEEIKRLKARYLNACDLKRPDEVKDCFISHGAVIDYKPIGRFENREAFVDIFVEMGCHSHIHDMHHGQNPEITIHDGGTASGRWGLFFYTTDTNNNVSRQLSGFYTDKYVRQDGVWKIASTVFEPAFVTDIVMDEDGTPHHRVLSEEG